jgi:hypothetical protein
MMAQLLEAPCYKLEGTKLKIVRIATINGVKWKEYKFIYNHLSVAPVQERLNTKLRVTQNIAAMLTGHGKTRAYLQRFKIIENATCACEQEDQTVDHILYHCTLLELQWQNMKNIAIKAGQWPPSKQHLITQHRDSLLNFLETIDFGEGKKKKKKKSKRNFKPRTLHFHDN